MSLLCTSEYPDNSDCALLHIWDSSWIQWGKGLRNWFIPLPWLSLSFPRFVLFSFFFFCVRMTDGGQQNQESGSVHPINGCGLFDQALDWTEINISPFKIYQKRIFESIAAACIPFHPPTTTFPLPSPHSALPCHKHWIRHFVVTTSNQ